MFVNLDWTLSTGILAVAKFPEQEDSLAHLLPERPLGTVLMKTSGLLIVFAPVVLLMPTPTVLPPL